MADEQEGQCQEFCPRINGKMPFKSNFVMFWGVEPARLSATISAQSPPHEIVYEGKGITLDMHVISWRKVQDGVYIIEAADDPYFWKNKRIAISRNDPVSGVDVSELANLVSEVTGWDVSGAAGEKVPYLSFSGSVVAAIELLERLTGGLATLDHVAHQISFGYPPIGGGGGIVVEEGYEVGTAQDVVCYGTLLSLPKDNTAASYDVPDWSWVGGSVPAEAWEISQLMPVSTTEQTLSEETERETWHESLPTGEVTHMKETTTQVVMKSVSIVFTAVTAALKQDEVLLHGSGWSPVVSFSPESWTNYINPVSGEVSGKEFESDISADRVISVSNLLEAQRKAAEIAGLLAESEKAGIYVIIAPDTDKTSAGFFFNFIVIVVGKVVVPYYAYTRRIEKQYVNGVLKDTKASVVSGRAGDTLPNTALISLYIRQRLLRYLNVKIDIENGTRVKFPYVVGTGMSPGKTLNLADFEGRDVMFVQLNEAPSINVASSYAHALAELLRPSRYVGVLDGSPEGATKYIEDFSNGMFRAIAYYRSGG